MLENNNDAEIIVRIFSLVDESFWTIGHVITYYTNSTLTRKYLTLLHNMLAEGFSPRRIAKLIASANELVSTMNLPALIRRTQQLKNVALQAEALSDEKIANTLSSLNFYNCSDLTIALNEALEEFGMNAD
jgi:hypothetical protein